MNFVPRLTLLAFAGFLPFGAKVLLLMPKPETTGTASATFGGQAAL